MTNGNPNVVQFNTTLPSGGTVAIIITNAINSDINAIQAALMAPQTRLPGIYQP